MLKIIVSLLSTMIPQMSAEIKKAIIDFLKSLEVKAKATPNPLDDIVVVLLIAILDD